jgi:hypothetical protein
MVAKVMVLSVERMMRILDDGTVRPSGLSGVVASRLPSRRRHPARHHL